MTQAALRNVQVLLDWHRGHSSYYPPVASFRPIRSVAVVGAGLMGTQLAATFADHGLRVLITDANADVLAAAPVRIARERAATGGGGPIETTSDDRLLAGCDLVLETVPEDVAVKRQVYARLAPQLAANTILATNTSAIMIRDLAGGLALAERFCGLHFCHPVRQRPLVEVVPGPGTSTETVTAAACFAQAIGKLPILVKDGPGFVVNRLLVRYANEALNLLADGLGIEEIDQAAVDFGMPWGALRLLDEIGLDVALAGGKMLHETFPDRILPTPLLPLLCKRGHLGCKTGRGFYLHNVSGTFRVPLAGNGTRPVSDTAEIGTRSVPDTTTNPEAAELAAYLAKQPARMPRQHILDRLLLAMLLEATLILDDELVSDPREIDLAVLFGLGFPEHQGGILYWADTLGATRIIDMLRSLEPPAPRFQPTRMLLEMAEHGRRFYG